ncbi:unnamed protein product [Periconia digitata]|uniref:Uncharacterized protein n=1 Tax=Periconia digitata TaxID=1303443 RepID=A0A9W4XXX7_9PLEO|nr:unnamed protein product [Periconia digitata]
MSSIVGMQAGMRLHTQIINTVVRTAYRIESVASAFKPHPTL